MRPPPPRAPCARMMCGTRATCTLDPPSRSCRAPLAPCCGRGSAGPDRAKEKSPSAQRISVGVSPQNAAICTLWVCRAAHANRPASTSTARGRGPCMRRRRIYRVRMQRCRRAARPAPPRLFSPSAVARRVPAGQIWLHATQRRGRCASNEIPHVADRPAGPAVSGRTGPPLCGPRSEHGRLSAQRVTWTACPGPPGALRRWPCCALDGPLRRTGLRGGGAARS